MWYLQSFFYLIIYIITKPFRTLRKNIHITHSKTFQKAVTLIAFPIIFICFPVVFRTGDITLSVMAVEGVILYIIYQVAGGLKGSAVEFARWLLAPFMVANVWSCQAMDFDTTPKDVSELIDWIMHTGKVRKKCPKVNRITFL